MDRIQTEPAPFHTAARSAPLTGICRPPNLTTAEANRLAEQIGGLSIRGHSAGSYAGMVWEEILAKFPNFIGTTVLPPPSI